MERNSTGASTTRPSCWRTCWRAKGSDLKPTIYAERIVKHFGLDHYFARVYGAELDGRFDDKAELLAHLLASEGIRSKADDLCGAHREAFRTGPLLRTSLWSGTRRALRRQGRAAGAPAGERRDPI